MKAKKGFATILSIAAFLFIFITFIVFFALFQADKKSATTKSEFTFQTMDTDLTLKTFLRMPSSVAPEDLGMLSGEQVTNADVLVRTCNANLASSRPYGILTANARTFFTNMYRYDWLLLPIYYTPDGKPISPANTKILKRIENVNQQGISTPGSIINSPEYEAKLATGRDTIDEAVALLTTDIRQPGVGSQVLPCLEGGKVLKVVLLAKEPEVWK